MYYGTLGPLKKLMEGPFTKKSKHLDYKMTWCMHKNYFVSITLGAKQNQDNFENE